MVLLLLNACTSIKKLADEGRYDEAISKAAKKLKGKDLKDPELVQLLERSFNKVNEKDLNIIKSLTSSNDWRQNEKVLRITKNIADRQNIIKPFLPLVDANGYTAQFSLINTNQINDLSRRNITEDLFSEASSLLEQSKKSDYKLARQAYQLFEKLESYQPDFENIHVLKNAALNEGQSHVLIDIVGKAFKFVPNDLKSKFIDMVRTANNTKWVVYHFDNDYNDKADYIVKINLEAIDVSPEKFNDTYHHFSKTVEDGFSYKLDAKGNVMKDTAGNDIKIPKFKEVKAVLREVNQVKEAMADVQIMLIDNRNGNIMRKSPINSINTFANHAIMITGDTRALPIEWASKIGGNVVAFPPDLAMIDHVIDDATRNAGNKFRNILNDL
jgi:hypothetical protein